MFKDLLFPHFTQDFCVVLCLVLMQVEAFLKPFFHSPVIWGVLKGMDMSTSCNIGTWTNSELFLPKLVHLNDVQQPSSEKLALI